MERLTEELGLGPDDVYRFAGPLGLDCLWAIHALDRPDLHDEPWTPLVPAAFTSVERDEEASIFSRAGPPGRPGPPSLRLVLGVGRGADQRGGRRPQRPGHQTVPVPDLRRQPGGGRPGPGGRARQAGGGAGRGDRPLRRGGQHRLGPRPRGGRGPRDLRTDGTQDPRQDHPGGAPGGRGRPPVLPRRYRQLQPQDSPDVRGPRGAVVPAGARGRRHPVLQLHHRVQPATPLPGTGHLPGWHPRPGGRLHRRAGHGRPRRSHRDQGQRTRRRGRHRRPLPGVPGRGAHRPDHPRHLLPASGRAGTVRDHPGPLHRGPVPRALADPPIRGRSQRSGHATTSGPPTSAGATSTAGSRP